MLARTAIAATAILAASTHAQSASSLLDGLSSTCQSAALSLLSNKDLASCSSIGSLSSIVLTSGSIVDSVNSWLGTLCGADDCSASTLQNASAVIENGCSSEISSGSELVTTVQAVIGNFNQVKEGLCLQYTSNNTLCVTDLLESMQNATGQALTVSYLTSLDASTLESLGTTSYCTDCAHGLVTKLDAALSNGTSSADSSSLLGAVVSVCGESFADGQVPSTLSEATGSNSTIVNGVESNSLNGAPSSSAGLWKMTGAALLGVAGVAALA
ncbi:hypothetical protein JCM10449v2_004346 [Rhodotorula kratochvilovae]